MPVAITHIWTDHQKTFKTPIELLQSSGRRRTFLRRKCNSSFVSRHVANHIRDSEQRTEGRADANRTGRIMGNLHQLASLVWPLLHS